MELEGSPYRYLLDDPDFNRWFNNVKRGSVATAHEWFRRMGRIHKQFGKTPKQMAEMSPKEAGNFIMDLITSMEREGKSGNYIANCVKPIKNWLQFNGIQVQQNIKIHGRNEVTAVANERTPTPDELKRILGMADFRAKAAVALVAFCGFRLEVLGDYLGKDGLRIQDLPEMTVKDSAIEFKKVPTMIVVRPALSKAGHQFFTFLAEEGCDYLKEYLEWRMRQGEKLTTKCPVITPINIHAGKHIRTINIGDLIRKPIRTAGFDWRPYVLRRYFDTRMMLAESDGMIIRDFRVFWMGHKGDMENTYTTNKQLSEDVIERMREAYAKAADKCLVTSRKQTMSQDMVRAQFNRQFLEMAGYSGEELDCMGDLSKLTPTDINKLIQDKSKQGLGLNGNNQKVVPMQEVKQWITQGWEYVTQLPTNDAVIKLPG